MEGFQEAVVVPLMAASPITGIAGHGFKGGSQVFVWQGDHLTHGFFTSDGQGKMHELPGYSLAQAFPIGPQDTPVIVAFGKEQPISIQYDYDNEIWSSPKPIPGMVAGLPDAYAAAANSSGDQIFAIIKEGYINMGANLSEYSKILLGVKSSSNPSHSAPLLATCVANDHTARVFFGKEGGLYNWHVNSLTANQSIAFTQIRSVKSPAVVTNVHVAASDTGKIRYIYAIADGSAKNEMTIYARDETEGGSLSPEVAQPIGLVTFNSLKFVSNESETHAVWATLDSKIMWAQHFTASGWSAPSEIARGAADPDVAINKSGDLFVVYKNIGAKLGVGTALLPVGSQNWEYEPIPVDNPKQVVAILNDDRLATVLISDGQKVTARTKNIGSNA